MLKNYQALFLGVFFTASQVLAQQSNPISTLIETPASAFDVFIFQLYEQSKCYQGWFGDRPKAEKSDLCMTIIEYNSSDNLIEMNLFVEERHEKMKGFRTASDKNKKDILSGILSEVAQTVGVETSDSGHRIGMIQMTKIRNGWGAKNFDENRIHEEIANRTVIHLKANIGRFTYTVTRDHHGKVTAFKEKSLIPTNAE